VSLGRSGFLRLPGFLGIGRCLLTCGSTWMKNWPCASGSGGSEPGTAWDRRCRSDGSPLWRPAYSGDLSGWSGRQARQGVQPASRAAARVILSRSLSPMKRMRMQLALWYLGTPGPQLPPCWGPGPRVRPGRLLVLLVLLGLLGLRGHGSAGGRGGAGNKRHLWLGVRAGFGDQFGAARRPELGNGLRRGRGLRLGLARGGGLGRVLSTSQRLTLSRRLFFSRRLLFSRRLARGRGLVAGWRGVW